MSAILVFSATVGFRHESVEAGVRAVQELATESNVASVTSEDAGIFTSTVLDEIDAVVWMQTSGTGLLDSHQRIAYEKFTQRGGGFAGVHAASDAERDWPLFSSLLCARFRAHPTALQAASIRIERSDDPSVRAVPHPWVRTDEWYAFETNPRSSAEVIASVAEESYSPSNATMGVDHPVIWRTRIGAANAWYTALGHDAAAFEDDLFRHHLWGGIDSVTCDDPEGEDQ